MTRPSPFINRNTAATYYGSVAVLWFAAGLRWDRDGRTFELRRLSAVVASLCCLAAVALSGSRAGFLLTVGVLAGYTLLCRPRRLLAGYPPRMRRSIIVGTALLTLALVELWGAGIAARVQAGGLSDESRMQVYATILSMIAERPLLGFGLGSFEAVFPAYRGAALGSYGVWDIAHSTPLELGVELGLPVLAIVSALWLWSGLTLLRAYRAPRRGRSTIAAALCIGGLGTAHSLVDFSLQIPGYGVIFAAVIGCGLGRATACLATDPSRDPHPHPDGDGATPS